MPKVKYVYYAVIAVVAVGGLAAINLLKPESAVSADQKQKEEAREMLAQADLADVEVALAGGVERCGHAGPLRRLAPGYDGGWSRRYTLA